MSASASRSRRRPSSRFLADAKAGKDAPRQQDPQTDPFGGGQVDPQQLDPSQIDPQQVDPNGGQTDPFGGQQQAAPQQQADPFGGIAG